VKTFPKVTCVGEVLVDFISTTKGTSLAGTPLFAKCAGGAAANVAAGLARLGIDTAMVAKVGDDAFGRFLRAELSRMGVRASGVTSDKTHKTRLAFVSLERSGEREFDFWQHAPADEQLTSRDLNLPALAKSAIVHIGSFLLLNNPSRSTALRTARALRAKGSQISFDPNLRLTLWKSASDARRVALAMTKLATILRLNEAEARFLTGRRSLQAAARALRELGPAVVVVTAGEEGCLLDTGHAQVFVKGYRVRAADTTGCGDAFLAGLLAGIARSNQRAGALSLASLVSICRFANAAGALCATRRGGIAAMPALSDVDTFLRRQK
jgi:fructokinase